jgi:hypothetical protein
MNRVLKRILWLIPLLLFLGLLTTLIIAGYIYKANWTGIIDSKGEMKTAWDWLDLFIVPAALGIFLWYLEGRDKKIEERHAHERYSYLSLQTFYDDITQQMRKNLLKDGNSIERARAKTHTIVKILNGEQKGLLLRFLASSELLAHNADGGGIDLQAADLSGVQYPHGYLDKDDLEYANFSGANLKGAYLRDAFMQGINLANANLTGADVTLEQLASAESLTGSTTPNGKKYRAGNREYDEIEKIKKNYKEKLDLIVPIQTIDNAP